MRDCENCKHHKENGCEVWECTQEEEEKEEKEVDLSDWLKPRDIIEYNGEYLMVCGYDVMGMMYVCKKHDGTPFYIVKERECDITKIIKG